MSLVLSIGHNIFLSKEDRYKLLNEEIEAVGVSVPVWFYQNKTSEPAHEVFCKYKIIPSEDEISIKQKDQVYEITLPKEDLNKDGKKHPVTIKNILNIKDGGMEWLAFRQYGKIKRKNKKTISLIHFLEVKPLEDILGSLT